MDLNLVIPCLLGLEAPIAEELRDIGAENINAEYKDGILRVELPKKALEPPKEIKAIEVK